MNSKCDLAYVDWDEGKSLSEECTALLEKFETLTEKVNIYDVFGKCYVTDESKKFALYQSNPQTLVSDS